MKKSLIIIPFNIPWNWSTDYTNQTAKILSQKGNIVICLLLEDIQQFSIKEFIRQRKKPEIHVRLKRRQGSEPCRR